jgi:2-polyprenyl-6-methoxyphenol hydroxylase-like FAD-dependent oxidoreductase
MSSLPVLIAGAGPTGLTAALELSRLGVPVRLVDRAPQPFPESRALAVQARTRELLAVRGLDEQLRALGNPVGRAVLHADGRPLADVQLHRMPSAFNSILMLAQSETERLLTEQLSRQGVKVERGVEVIGLEGADGDGPVTVRLRSTSDQTIQRVTASYVIAADGPHSTLRKALGLPFPGRTLPQDYLLADLHVDGPVPDDQVSIHLSARGFVAVFPMSGGRFRLMATDPEGSVGATDTPTVAQIQRLWDRAARTSARLHTLHWSSRFRINSRHLRTLRAGRVFFGGDAAHVHSPAGGQGMNLGIQDMVNLCWKLAMVLDGRAKPELLETYSSERLPVIKQLVRFTEIGTRIFTAPNPVVHAVRIRVAPRMLARDRVQDAAAAMFGQLSAGYRGGALTRDAGSAGELRAGDRVPDEHGLYRALDLGALTLVRHGPMPAVDAVAARWAGVVTVCDRDRVAGPGRWLLVRPDGYLAAAGGVDDTAGGGADDTAVGGADDAARLDRWLHRWFHAPSGV